MIEQKKQGVLSVDYEENLRALKEILRPGTNFDIICREITVAGEDAALFYIDGFTKDEVMQKLMQYFMGMKGYPRKPTPARGFAKLLPYVEVEVKEELEELLTMILSGASVLIAPAFGAEAIVIDSRTYPARQTEEPSDDRVMQGALDGFV